MQDSNARISEHRGFAAMDAEKQRQIASKGGKAAHLKGTAHEFSPQEARAAGRKGGEARARHAQQLAAAKGILASSSVRTERPRDADDSRTDAIASDMNQQRLAKTSGQLPA